MNKWAKILVFVASAVLLIGVFIADTVYASVKTPSIGCSVNSSYGREYATEKSIIRDLWYVTLLCPEDQYELKRAKSKGTLTDDQWQSIKVGDRLVCDEMQSVGLLLGYRYTFLQNCKS